MAEARMTPTERLVLEALCRAVQRLGQPPSPEQIRESAGLPSLAAVHFFLDSLQRKKLIRRDPARPRVIEIHCGALAAESAQQVAAAPIEEERNAHTPGGAPPEPATAETAAQEGVAAMRATPADEPPSAPPMGNALDAMAPAALNEIRSDEIPQGRVFGRGDRPGGTDPTLVTVPLLGRVAAGHPIDTVPGEVEATYQLPRAFVGRKDPLFMVRVQGASMLGRGIHDQDLVVVHRQPDAENGQIVVVCDENGDAAVKRFWRSDDGQRVELRSANPDFGPLDVAQAEILGSVVTVIRTL